MQFGQPKKSNLVGFIWTSIVSIVITALIWHLKSLSLSKTIILFLTLEGTGWLACAFSQSGHVPPQGNLIKWFFTGQGAVPVYYNRPMFWGGLTMLALSYILNIVTN